MCQTRTLGEWGLILGIFALLALSVAALLPLMDRIWAAGGLFRGLSTELAGVFGTNRDPVVAAVLGVLVGWFFLFVVDSTKRVQATLSLVVIGGVLLPGLLTLDRVVGAVARVPLVFVLFGGFGVATGAPRQVVGLVASFGSGNDNGGDRVYASRGGLTTLVFPVASLALFCTLTLVVAVYALQYPFVVPLADAAIGVLATGVFVCLLFLFVQYEHERRIAVVYPPLGEADERLDTYLIGGLFGHVSDNYPTRAVRSAADLRTAAAARNGDGLGSFKDRAEFRFAPSDSGLKRILSRTVVLSSEGYRSSKINHRELEATRDARSGGAVRGLVRLAQRMIIRAIPRRQTPESFWKRNSPVEVIDRSDAVFLVTPAPEADEDRPEHLSTYARVCETYAEDPLTDVVLVVTHAARALDQFEEANANRPDDLNNGPLNYFVRDELVGDACSEVVLVDRDPDAGYDLQNAEALVRRL